MPIPSTLESLSPTIGSNVPAEGDGTLMTSVNDGLRAAYGFIRQALSSGSDIASASTITPPSTASSFNITGTTAITAIASTNSWNGRVIALRFEGSVTITHSSSLVLPGATNISAVSGDYAMFRQYSSGVWHCIGYLRTSGAPLVSGGTSATFLRGDGALTDTIVGVLKLNASSDNRMDFLDSGDSNRGGVILTTNSAFWFSSNSGARGTVIGQDSTAVISIDTNKRTTVASTSNPLTVTSNTSTESLVTHSNGDVTGSSGLRVLCSGGAAVDMIAAANSYGVIGTSSNHALRIKTNNIDAGLIDANGVFIIGSTAAASTEKLLVKQTGGSSATTIRCWNNATTGDSEFIGFSTEASITSRGSINYNRSGGQVAYNTTSDYRAKDVLGAVEDSGSIIDSMNVVLAQMKWATMPRPMLIAHELQALAPYAVTGEKDAVDDFGNPKYQQVDHASLIPLLITEIRSLRERVAALEGAGGVNAI